MPLSNKFENK